MTRSIEHPDETGKRERPFRVLWRSALLRSDLRGTAKLVGCVLAEYMDEAGRCFPSTTTIGRGASLARSTTHDAIEVLDREGFLAVTRTTGGDPLKTRNRYRALVPSQTRPGDGPVRETDPSGSRRDPSGSRSRPVREPVTNQTTNQEGTRKTLARSRDRAPAAYTPVFESFWTAFDHKLDKVRAFRAWTKALAEGADPDEIIAGASRYRAWIEAQPDPPRRKYPEGWISGRRWEDELPAPAGDWIDEELRRGSLRVVEEPREEAPR